jgi:predicted  nucleic acid-binding Zn-ribbon protein
VLRTKREKMVAGIAWADLQLYEKLRKAKHGTAIAGLEHDVCQACRVTVPAGTLRTVKQGLEFVYCPSCARVLHPGARGDLVRW